MATFMQHKFTRAVLVAVVSIPCWVFTVKANDLPPAPPGPYTFTATDLTSGAVGNTAPASNSVAVVDDTMPPPPPAPTIQAVEIQSTGGHVSPHPMLPMHHPELHEGLADKHEFAGELPPPPPAPPVAQPTSIPASPPPVLEASQPVAPNAEAAPVAPVVETAPVAPVNNTAPIIPPMPTSAPTNLPPMPPIPPLNGNAASVNP
jgi:hypothetical protein